MIARRIHDFSYGHTVKGHEGKCQNLHGHNGRITFEVEADTLDDVGRVLDFGIIKSKLCQWVEDNWDHRFLVWIEDERYGTLLRLDSTVVPLPFNPTAENMAQYLVEIVGPAILAGLPVKLVSCTVEETRKCSATYEKN